MRTLKIGLSCFLGGFIGGIVAFSVNPYVWWLGMLVGALVGWIAWDFKGFVKAIPQAWERAISKWPTREEWVEISMFLAVLFVFIGSFGISFLVLVLVLGPIWGPLAVLSGMGSFMFVCESEIRKEGIRKRGRIISNKEILLWSVLRFNFFAFSLYYLPLGIFLALREICLGLYLAFRGAVRFIKYLFLLVHSEERLLCGTDAAFGVFIGYQLGHPIFCGIAAAIAGMINYELLSKRVLRQALVHFESTSFSEFFK